MFGTHDLALFIASGLLLNMAPGPDSLLVMTRSATQGWRAGSAAALGICSGTFVHIFGAALGLSAVLATSATAFTVVKLLGAAYLLYAGLAMLLAKASPRADAEAAPPAPLPLRKIYLQGFLTNALNPKVAVFFLAFVPQFIAPESTTKALAFIALGCLFNATSLMWSHLLAAFTVFASRRLRVNEAVGRWLHRAIGAVFVSFGIKLALADNR
jgi:threonine/homoserine/homoserine lactone efflux protein